MEYQVSAATNKVEAWSTVRLPFEPKGWLLDYRAELREALRSMRVRHDDLLVAEYASPSDDLADLENVLLYNLGSGCYAALARSGLVCVRSASPDDRHHVTYEVRPDPRHADFADRFSGQTIATATFDGVVTGDKAARWWATTRPSLETSWPSRPVTEFAISISLGPAWDHRSIASLVKPMLDGLISGLHVHDGSSRDHILSALGGVEVGERWWELLTDSTSAVLGPRRLVRPHGDGIAWNPADELCSAFRVVRDRAQREGFRAEVIGVS